MDYVLAKINPYLRFLWLPISLSEESSQSVRFAFDNTKQNDDPLKAKLIEDQIKLKKLSIDIHNYSLMSKNFEM